MNNTAISPHHEEVRMLIPWYLNGTLAELEATLVRTHVESCSECHADLAVHERMRLAIIQDEATPIVPSLTASELLDRLAPPESRADSWSRYSKYAVAASLAALVATVALTTDFWSVAENQTYRTATSVQKETKTAYVLQLQFEVGITPDDRERVLDELGGVDIRELENTEAYEMLIHVPNASLDELEAFANQVQSRPEVRSAEFVALQLPVR